MLNKCYVVEGTVTALSPVFHGGDEKTGSTPVLRTIMTYVNGKKIPLPHVSGNGVRGKLRRLAFKDFLDLVGYEVENPKLHHSLFSGGGLESTEGDTGVIDLELRKKVRALIPPMALFGGNFGNQSIQGIIIIEHMWPICEEYASKLPERFRIEPYVKEPVRIFLDQTFITRRDDLRAEREEGEQAIQMKVDYECFIPGTKFYHRFVLQFPNPVQISCFGRVLDLFAAFPYVGGRSSAGDGKVELVYENRPSADLYLNYVEEKKEEIRALLAELEARL